jgi:hypothetical protein
VRSFLLGLSVAFLSTLLLATGLGHALRFARFRADLRDHALVPRRATAAIASLVTVAELGVGAVCASVLLSLTSPATPSTLVSATVAASALAIALLLYLGALLRQPPRVLSCGCSFLSGQLTPVSIAPAASLLFFSMIGLALASPGDGAGFEPVADTWAILSAGWGMTLAVLVLAVPAVVAPRVEMERESYVA